MAGLTVREAVSSLGATLRHRFGTHPFHTEKGSNPEYTLNVREHLTAIDSVSPSQKYQKAITPEFLQCMAGSASWELLNDPEKHTTDLVIGAFFFPLRSCEFSHVPVVRKTVNIWLGGIRFYAQDFQVIPHHYPQLLELAVFVWVLFEDQKNRLKCDSCTQMKTWDPCLCPVNSIGRAFQRVIKFVKDHNDNTPLCTFHKRRRRSKYITQDDSLKFIRKICKPYGGVKRFGFHKEEIGNRSI